MTSLADKVARVKELDAKRDDICNSLVPSDIRMMQALVTQLWDENQKQREVLVMAREGLDLICTIEGERGASAGACYKVASPVLTAIDNVMKGEGV